MLSHSYCNLIGHLQEGAGPEKDVLYCVYRQDLQLNIMLKEVMTEKISLIATNANIDLTVNICWLDHH